MHQKSACQLNGRDLTSLIKMLICNLTNQLNDRDIDDIFLLFIHQTEIIGNNIFKINNFIFSCHHDGMDVAFLCTSMVIIYLTVHCNDELGKKVSN